MSVAKLKSAERRGDNKIRCFGNKPGQELYAKYHDEEWGILVTDEHKLFEMLILEGAQAGLSWFSILCRREGYRQLFHNFIPESVAVMTDAELERLRSDNRIIRNRLKIFAARDNAKAFLKIQAKFGSFSDYLWRFMDGSNQPIKNHWSQMSEIPLQTEKSRAISSDLRTRGMKFVGPVIIYSYMQAIGMVNDHLTTCWRH